MAHLNDEQLFALAREEGTSTDREHAQGCEICAERVQMWRLAAEGLPQIQREEVRPSEMHLLQTMFRHNAPEKQSVIRWVASLIRSSAAPVAVGVRGSSTAELYEYEAGPFTLMLESGPRQRGILPVHGQVFHSDPEAAADARIVIATDDGLAFVDQLNEFGEFHFEITEPGRYHTTVWTREGAFRIEDLDLGEDSGE